MLRCSYLWGGAHQGVVIQGPPPLVHIYLAWLHIHKQPSYTHFDLFIFVGLHLVGGGISQRHNPPAMWLLHPLPCSPPPPLLLCPRLGKTPYPFVQVGAFSLIYVGKSIHPA